MNSKNQNLLSYTFLLIQQKLNSMNLENIRQLAVQFHINPNQNLSFLISELSQQLYMQTVGIPSNSNLSNLNTSANNANVNSFAQSYNETLQKYMLFSNLEKNYYNILMSNASKTNPNCQGNVKNDFEEQKNLQSQMLKNLNIVKLGTNSNFSSQISKNQNSDRYLNSVNCVCDQKHPTKENYNKIVQCSKNQCKSNFHEKCINYSNVEAEFECPKCVLSSLDPFNKVISQVSDFFYIPNQNDNLVYDFMFTLTQDHMRYMMENPDIGLEIRSVSLNAKEMHETTWIDYGELYLNSFKLCEFTPLNLSISLKKRKDEKIFTRENIVFGVNFIKVMTKKINPMEKNQFKVSENAKHLMAVFLVEKQSWSQVRNNIHILNESACRQKVLKQFVLNKNEKNCDDTAIKVDKITISMADTLDLNLIETPARGSQCDHLQCFSLENYLKMMENSFPRKFKCPICKARCYNLYIDGYFVKILNDSKKNQKNFKEISFFKDGSYALNEIALEKESNFEELQSEDAYAYDEFCWNNTKNDCSEMISKTNKKNCDVIIIEEEEEDEQKQQVKEIPTSPFQMTEFQSNFNGINEMKMWKIKQIQMQMYLSQMQAQQINPQSFTKMSVWNEAAFLKNQMEMEAVLQSGINNGYFQK